MEQLSEKLFDLLKNIPKSYYFPIIVGMAGLICLCIGLIQLKNSYKENSNEQVINENKQATVSAIPFGIQVDVEGAVVHPGVYKLPQNARVQDVLIAAGGLSALADREVIAKSVNLASKLTDGMKLYIPKIGEIPVQAGSGMQTQGTVLGVTTSLININTATESQLDSLAGIGPVTAQKIISARPYGSIEELTSKKVLSQSVFAKIKDKITVY